MLLEKPANNNSQVEDEKTILRGQIGSRPPRCERRCGSCGHCEAIQVPTTPQIKNAKKGLKNPTAGSVTIQYARGSPQYQSLDSPNSFFYGMGGGYMVNPGSPTMMSNGVNLPPLFDNFVVAAVMGALNDATIIKELLALHKAYLACLLSPLNSQYSLNHGHYGNSAYGLDMWYPKSPLGSSLMPNSALGFGSPGIYGERSLRFPSVIRNLVGGERFASSLLDEFKRNKPKCLELSEIVRHVVEFKLIFLLFYFVTRVLSFYNIVKTVALLKI
uniref:Epidermal patterning factor-like protein n=1 Tax=Tanacetum cinerariifolium TaxID=118510 RepID=A0A6L2MPN2_TANCI|nr:pumilio homolog 1-like [Tanacetum cinerariifolium]